MKLLESLKKFQKNPLGIDLSPTFSDFGVAPKNKQPVKVVALEPTTGMIIKRKHLSPRRRGVCGTAGGWVPGHGGDVYWVTQSKKTAAYSLREIAPIDDV